MAKDPTKPPTAGRKPASKRRPSASPKKKSDASKSPKKPTVAAKSTQKRKPSAKSTTKAPRKRANGPVTTKFREPVNWRRVFLREVAFVSAAVGCGLLITGSLLWSRAQRDIAYYLDNPPQTYPGTIYSAPANLSEGQQATLPDVTIDLLAAGYERVNTLNGPKQFRIADESTLKIRNPTGVAGVDGGDVEIRFNSDRVSRITPGDSVALSPVVLATVGETSGRRSPVTLNELSPWMEPALLAMEDSRFREHRGVDPRGIFRALVHNLTGGGGMHGGSTLTQQLAKNLFLSSERTIQRKIREAFFAACLEANLSKDQILELYLSEVYLGQAAGMPIHGVEQAARAWFGISSARLDLAQAATIAGVISAPNRYSPSRHPERAAERRDLVLQRMVSEGRISEEQSRDLQGKEVRTSGQMPGAGRRAPWAVDAAIDLAESELGAGALFSSGHNVYTTIQPALQRAAEHAVAQGLAELDMGYPKASGAQAALVAVRISDGAIVAMVGGRDYQSSPFNRAMHAWRQAGSTVKPLTMLAALEADPDLSPISLMQDEPITRTVDGKTWSPQNYDGKFEGEITLRKAIEGSRNIPAITMAEAVGLSNLHDFFRRLGLSKSTYLPSAALGSFRSNVVEMAGAYTVFSGGGNAARPFLVAEIHGRDNERLFENTVAQQAIATSRSAALATHVLQGVMTHGTGQRAEIYGAIGSVAGKTGTTDDYRDAWFTGITPDFAVAVWVGQDRGTLGLSGSRAALPIWARFVSATGDLTEPFSRPAGLETAFVSRDSWRVVPSECPNTYEELFREGQSPVPSKWCDRPEEAVAEISRVFSQLFSRPKKRKGKAEPVKAEIGASR